jgi:hypothetical protein
MKKLASIVGLIVISLILGGCGNSPDGDKQRVSFDYVSPSL